MDRTSPDRSEPRAEADALATAPPAGPPPGLATLGWLVGWIGNTIFGGGTATIAILERALLDRRWLDREETQLVFAMARLTPGTNVLAFCAGIGWLLRGWRGALLALLAASVPCSIAAVLLTIGYQAVTSHALARFALRGAMASAVALMFASCWMLLRGSAQRPYRLQVALLFAAAFLLEVFWSVAPVRIIAISAAVGALWPVTDTPAPGSPSVAAPDIEDRTAASSALVSPSGAGRPHASRDAHHASVRGDAASGPAAPSSREERA